MKTQNQIVISLGSNVGDKMQHIEHAIAVIHNEIATVIKVASIYETPAWGFDGAVFYNTVILTHTFKTPQKVLSQLLQLEKKMGRIRTQASGYEARIIDLDIISCNEEIISTDTLNIPHARMHERKFVLQPFLDLQSNWTHPKFNKSVLELLNETSDKSACVFVKNIVAPVEKLALNKFNYIAIEGNIGAGKTTLASKIAQDCNAKLVLERFADNPFLPKFYRDQNRYAFPLEMSFLADRYQQISDDLSQFDLFKDFIIADYHIIKSMIFAKVTLQEDEFRLYKTMFDIIHKETAKPDLYIYLYQNTDRLLENIKKRGRKYEQEIPAAYLDKINRGYLDYIKSQTEINTLVIDVSELDFVKNQQDYLFVLDQIASCKR